MKINYKEEPKQLEEEKGLSGQKVNIYGGHVTMVQSLWRKELNTDGAGTELLGSFLAVFMIYSSTFIRIMYLSSLRTVMKSGQLKEFGFYLFINSTTTPSLILNHIQ